MYKVGVVSVVPENRHAPLFKVFQQSRRYRRAAGGTVAALAEEKAAQVVVDKPGHLPRLLP